MNKNDRIINNINATMSMENLPLLKEDKERLRDCLEDKVSYEDAIDKLIEQYIHFVKAMEEHKECL